MNYIGLLKNIEEVALELNTVNSFYDGDVYNNWNNQEVRYGSINVGLESTTRTDNTVIYNVVIYYADRLLQDKSNKNSIWTDATNTITSIISGIDSSISYEGPLNITHFEQKFADYLAGGYVRVGLEVNFDLGECDLDESRYIVPALFITRNGAYNVTDYEIADVNIPVPSLTELDVTENGTYTAQNYDGYNTVRVNVPEQKPETTLTTTIIENGTRTFTPQAGQVYDSAVITTNIKTWQSEYNEAINTITDLTLEVNDKNRTISTLNAQITSLNLQITQKENTISQLNAEVSAKNADIAAKSLTIEQLNSDIRDLNTLKASLLSQIADLNDEVALKQAEINRLNGLISGMGVLNATENGTYDPSGSIGWHSVNINVRPELQDKTISENGTYTADNGFYGLDEVTVNVQPDLQEKTVTENGEVTPDQGYDGLSRVVVNVQEEKPEDELEETITENGSYEYLPTSGHVFSKATFTANIKTWLEEYNAAQATISELNGTIEQKNATISDLNIQINRLNVTVSQKELEISQLNQTIATKDATIADQASEIAALEEEVDRLSEEIDDLNDTIFELRSNIQDLNSQISTLNTQLLQKDVIIDNLQRQIDSVTTKTITENGTYTAPQGVLGWNEISVNVDTSKPEEGLDAFINQNGDYTFNPDEGYVYDGARVRVNVQPELQNKVVNENGEVTADNPYYGLSKVTVNVDPRRPEDILEQSITENGHQVIFPESGHVFKMVNLDIDVDPELQNKTVTQNGTYVADSGYDGLGTVTVDVDTRKPEATLNESIRRNGQYTFRPAQGYVYNEVNINANVGLKQEETLNQTITQNGSYHYETDDPLNKVYSDANITVNVQPPLQSKSVTENGNVTPDDGYYGLSSVNVNVDPRRPEEHLVETITSNGTTTYTPTPGSVFSDAAITVNVQPPLQAKTTTDPNTTVTPDNGYYGLSSVAVNVPLGSKTLSHNGTYDVSQESVEGWTEVTVAVPLGSKTLDRNGTFTPAGEGVDGWNEVTVNFPLGSKSITTNGTYTPQAGEPGGWDEVTVNVQPPLQNKTIQTNGTYTADQGYYGLDEVTVDVQPPLQDKTLEHNGTYTCDSGYYGLDEVTVSVPLGPKLLEHNGTYTVSGENVDGWNSVTVDVPLGTKNIAHNGTYTPQAAENVDGYNEVVVAVPLGTKNIAHNGQYTPQPAEGVDGYDVVNVAVPIGQKTVNHNGTYTVTGSDVDGWDEVTVAVPLGTKTINHNGTYPVDPSTENVDGYDEVVVAVPLGSKSITENGTYTPQPAENVDGYNSVTVNVQPPLQDKTFRQDGTYTADQGYYGLGTVIVDTGIKCVEITEAQYNALPTKDQNTYYGITDSIPTGEAVTDTILSNGTYQYAPSAGYNAISNATITVNVPTVAANLDSKVITANGTYTPPTGTDGWDEVTVTVPSDQKPEETLTQTITAQGTTTYTPTSGSVFDSATITVAIPEETLTDTISTNGTYTYTPTSGSLYDGATITVACPLPKTEEHGSHTFSANTTGGAYRISPTSGNVFDYVDVTVEVPQPTLSTLNVSTNNTYIAPTGTAYDTVVVSCPEPKTEEHGSHTFLGNTQGAYRISPTSGNVFDYVDVTVNVPQNSVAPKSASITSNGTYVAQTTDNIDGYSQVVVAVPQNTIGAKTTEIVANGTYLASSDNLDGYTQVTVAVPTITYVELTQAEYDALTVKDNNTIYLITPAS